MRNTTLQDGTVTTVTVLPSLVLRAVGIGLMGVLLLAVLLTVHITQGQAELTIRTVFQAVFQPADESAHHIVRSLRMPRAVIGAIAGAALAVAGVLLQTVTRNPLASAGTLGISSGAYLTVTIMTIFFPALLWGGSLPAALLGGIAAAVLVFALSGGLRSSPIRLALAGMAVTMSLAGVTAAFQLIYENEASKLFLWGAGSLIQNGWDGVYYALPWTALGIAAALFFARRLDVLSLDEEVAEALGIRVRNNRLAMLAVAVVLAAVTVSVVGPIGFIGLIAPHLMRLIGLRKHLLLLPTAAIWGAALLVGADTLSRMVYFTLYEMPAGAITAMLGGPWLIWLALRAGRGSLRSAGAISMGERTRTMKLPYSMLVLAIVILLGLLMAAGLMLGGLRIHAKELWQLLIGSGSDMHHNIILNLRLPRMLVAAVAGAALAVSGLLLQGVVRNPLADPSLIGITSGAGIGGLLSLLLWPDLPIYWLPLAAFAGAVACAAIVFLFSAKGGLQPAMLALIGLAVSAMGSAAIQLLVIKAELRAAVALAWIAGSTYARGWSDLLRLLPWPLLLLPIAWLQARRLDILALGDDSAAGVGLPITRSRLWLALMGVALAAAAVSTVGTVGFVGLLAPHAARLLVGHQHRKLLVVSALLGAILLALADLVGRTVFAPKEIPSGLVVSVIGAFYFLWLMRPIAKK
jgi:ferric hydroxamate transport system permease protein